MHGVQRKLGSAGAERRGDAGNVEPDRSVKNALPIKISGRCHRYRGMGTVVDDVGGALVGSGLQVIQAEPVPLAGNERGIHAVATQKAEARLPDRIGREGGHECDIQTKLCQ